MSRPIKLASATKTYNLVLRQKAWDRIVQKSADLSELTQKQVSAADIIRLCIDLHMEKTCDEIERRFRAQRY